MSTIKQIILQEMNEKRFNRRFIDGYIREFFDEHTEMQEKIVEGTQLVQQYLDKTYYESKNVRIAQLRLLDVTELVTDILVGVAYVIREELFTSVAAKLASKLGFTDKSDAVKTTAELLAVLCLTDVFDINKFDKMASLKLKSNIPLSPNILEYINNSHYMPPMVCKPLELENNYSSGYLSHKDSLILGNGNHHDGDICLDVLNIMNSTCLSLDTRYLCSVEEDATFTLDTPEKNKQWTDFKTQSYGVYELLAKQGNEFYLCHKVDKRGRVYSQGYHVNTQGTAFKKSMCELAQTELIEGMPC